MAKAAAGTKETALRAMREGTQAKMNAASLKAIAEAAAIAKAKKKSKKGGQKPKPKVQFSR